jgi:hypothetical protein
MMTPSSAHNTTRLFTLTSVLARYVERSSLPAPFHSNRRGSETRFNATRISCPCQGQRQASVKGTPHESFEYPKAASFSIFTIRSMPKLSFSGNILSLRRELESSLDRIARRQNDRAFLVGYLEAVYLPDYPSGHLALCMRPKNPDGAIPICTRLFRNSCSAMPLRFSLSLVHPQPLTVLRTWGLHTIHSSSSVPQFPW